MIHDFSTQKQINNPKVVTEKPRIPELTVKAQSVMVIPLKKPAVRNHPQEPIIPKTIDQPPVADQFKKEKYYEGIESDVPLAIADFDKSKINIIKFKPLLGEYEVYNMGDEINDERKAIMSFLGLDIGTKTIVAAYKTKDGTTNYISEINGYWPFERSTPFIENMLKDPSKVRSDGTKRSAHYFKHDESNQCIVLGRDAEEFAYAKNDTLKRPMAEGGITPDEMSMTVLSSIIHGILNTAENDLGKFDSNLDLCFCTTAPAINKQSNIEYHERVLEIILKSYNSESNIKLHKIKESHAVVLNMSGDGTGIGISWGAGTVTVSYVKYGLEVYSFCWVGAGDWIDDNVAIRHGYDPNAMKTMKKASKETPTTVSKSKMSIDLTPGTVFNDRLLLDISLHYDVLISQVVSGIISGFHEHEAEARIEDGVNIYMAGGTSSPNGFAERVAMILSNSELPFKLGTVTKSDKPLYAVSSGCLAAAEMFTA